MKHNTIYSKVAVDMFLKQSLWAFGFLGVLLLVHIGKIIASLFTDFEISSYFNQVFIAANIFMFVVGILCINFLPHFAQNGVTRKDYFKGSLLAALGLSVALPIITILISTFEQFIINLIGKITFQNPDINSVVQDIDTDGNIIGNIVSSVVQSFVVPPYVDPTSNWVLAIAIVSINIFIYYLIGWLISATFYKLGTIPGLGLIVVGAAILVLKDTLLRLTLELPIPKQLEFLEILPKSIAAITALVLIVINLGLIRSLTKNVTIKL